MTVAQKLYCKVQRIVDHGLASMIRTLSNDLKDPGVGIDAIQVDAWE